MKSRRKPLPWLFLLVFAGSLVTVVGCGPKEESSKDYYTGPIKKKGGSTDDAPGTPGATTQPPAKNGTPGTR